jgi:hypothetical protein
MRAGRAIAFAVALGSCREEPQRVFRVIFPAVTFPVGETAYGALPPACYQPDDLAMASAPEQRTAEAYCQVAKAPASSGGAEGLLLEQSWTLFDDGSGRQVLVTRPVPDEKTELVLEGSRQGNRFLFVERERESELRCPPSILSSSFAPQLMLCGHHCVNSSADPSHCGSCEKHCGPGQMCSFGTCQSSCPVVQNQLCAGRIVDLATDSENCGMCSNACPAGTVCSPVFGSNPSQGGRCQSPCDVMCGQSLPTEGCMAPSVLTRTIETSTHFELSGDTLSGELTQSLSYACVDGGCAADFDARCPSCAVTVPVAGRVSP